MPSKRRQAIRDSWTLFTNHGAVLLYIALRPQATVRQMAEELAISPRTVLRMLADLTASGHVTIKKTGRRNCYHVHPEQGLGRPELEDFSLAKFLESFSGGLAKRD